MEDITISQSWSGSGKHNSYVDFYKPTLFGDIYFTTISESRNVSTKTSTFILTNNISYPLKANICSLGSLYQNQSYTIKLGNITRTGTIADHSSYSWLTWDEKVPFPDLTYSVQHIGDISVPYSLTYTATAKIDQNEECSQPEDYRTFTVTVTYSGTFQSRGFYNLYGSVNNQSKLITTLYCSVNGQSKEIKKLYGSVNGKSKRIY